MNEEKIWNYLKGKGLTDIAVAGIMGNLYAESGLLPNNLQNTYNSILMLSDDEYTKAVDNGSYTNFVYDQAGYGLGQWTFWSRKRDLQKLAKDLNKSIADLYTQLDFLVDELKEFGLFNKVNACTTIRDASNLILNEYEKPYDTGSAVQTARANYAQGYYNEFHNKPVQPQVPDPIPAQDSGNFVMLAIIKDINSKTAADLRYRLEAEGFYTMIMPGL